MSAEEGGGLRRFTGRGRNDLAYALQGAGPLLVCHPGGPGFAAGHLGSLGGLDATRSLVLFDPRGAGASAAASSYRLADYVEDLEDLRGHLEIERLDLFGHSHGGYVVARYSAAYPDAVARLVIDGTPLRPAAATPPASAADYFTTYEGGEAYLARWGDQADPTPSERFFADEFVELDLSDDVGRIACPTLVIVGERDPWTGGSAAAEMAALLPHGHAAVVAGAGHFAWLDAPADYAAAVERFLASS